MTGDSEGRGTALRVAGIGLAALALAVVAAWLMRPSTEVEVAGTAPVAAAPTVQRPAAVAGGEAPAPPPAEAPSEEPETPPEEALQVVAELAGEGMIRCPAPGVGDSRIGGGFSFAEVRGGVFTALVLQPEGANVVNLPNANLFEPDPADQRVITWSGAWPGTVRTCTFAPVELVSITGTVVHTNGRPAAGHVVRGCGDEVRAGRDGRFELSATAGIPCTLHARPPRDPTAFGLGLDLVPTAGTPPVTLEQTLPTEVQPGAQALLDLFASAPSPDEATDPFALALERDDLSADARAVLEEWADDRAEARAQQQEMRDRIELAREQREAAEAAGEWPIAFEDQSPDERTGGDRPQ